MSHVYVHQVRQVEAKVGDAGLSYGGYDQSNSLGFKTIKSWFYNDQPLGNTIRGKTEVGPWGGLRFTRFGQ